MNSVAIIVPFREQAGQNRLQQLKAFRGHMTQMMNMLLKEHKIKEYQIYVMGQTGLHKFNRGLLLNIGAHYAKDYDTLIFHDVDLLPELNLREWYAKKPEPKKPIHIAGCWTDRYEGFSYFGGIVSFRSIDFRKVNGFPNTFWGWGGEDDALRYRCNLRHFHIKKVTQGKIHDMECTESGCKMGLSEKLAYLKSHPYLKCTDKWEQREQDKISWLHNGVRQVSSLHDVRDIVTEGKVTLVTVDLIKPLLCLI